MHCVCRKAPEGFTAAPGLDGGFNYDFWVCSRCGKPTLQVFRSLTDMYAPARATRLASVVAHADGTSTLTWATEVSGEYITTMTYKAYPRKIDMDQGRGHLQKFWAELDREIDTIRSATAPELVEYNKNRATTLAWVLAELMRPFYEDGNAVLRESMERWKARQAGTTRESPGLAESIWDPNTRFDGTLYSVESEAKARKGPAKPKVVLDEQKINFIKHCLAQGTMTVEVLAGMFDCTIEDIKAAAA